MSTRSSRELERSASGSAADTRDLLRFLPSLLVKQLRDHSESTSGGWREAKEPLSAAFLFVDIFGLHKLSGQLSLRKGKQDENLASNKSREEKRQEDIMAALVDGFQRIVSIVLSHGGDVIKFTGDGMLIVWPFARSGPERAPAARRAVISACRCALDLLSQLNGAMLFDEEAYATGGKASGVKGGSCRL